MPHALLFELLTCMHGQKKIFLQRFLSPFFILVFHCANAQMVTGVWHGRMDKQRVEVKIILNGDSLAGTSYYYESPSQYRRYSIKGYFDANDNSAVWWDDQLIEDKTGLNLFGKNKPEWARADFNCPGGGVMKLDGKVYDKNQQAKGDVHLDKVQTPAFNDEWDYVIENYIVGANDPDFIDSIALIAKNFKNHERTPEDNTETVSRAPIVNDELIKKETVAVPITMQENKTVQNNPYEEKKVTAPNIEQKFTSREKVFNKEIPLTGDSIELRFYDDAIVDGDSISLFLNGKLIFEHIALTEKPYVVKLAVNGLQQTNELIMVAENLGSIPPNTSYMVALVGDKRYDAQLASTENSSAMIRLEKTTSQEP